MVGAAGYAGFELTRLLLRHPRVEKPLLFSRDCEGGSATLNELYPHIGGNGSYPLEKFSWDKLEGVNLLFMATPHEVSREWVPEAVARGIRVVDLSGAWRLKNARNRAVYAFSDADPAAAQKLDDAAVYGLPELHRDEIDKVTAWAEAVAANAGVGLPLAAPLLAGGVG